MATERKPRVVMHFRLSETLRVRAEACAEREGLSVTEFAREALRLRCEVLEARWGPERVVSGDDDPEPFLHPDLERYEGALVDGVPHGAGVMSRADGTRYEGEYRDGKEHGRGVMTFPDGTRYEGEWREGQPHGQGVYTKVDV